MSRATSSAVQGAGVDQLPIAFAVGPFPVIRFGIGSVSELPGAVRATGAESVLVVTDRGLADSAVLADLITLLGEAGIAVQTFAGVHPNPTTDDIAAGAAAARSASAAAVVSLGGGSAMDAAKGIALAAATGLTGTGLAWGSTAEPGLPIIAVPTTSGTGAECNDFGVITDVASHRKFYVGGPSCLARTAILDPALTISLPPGPTAASGMDCLTHAIESYLSIRANPWADGLDLQVVSLVSGYLRRAVRDGGDLVARSHLLLAANTAGQAMSTTGLGIVHGIGHPLGGRHDVPHGVALSLIIRECLMFSLPVRAERLARLALALGVDSGAASAARNAEAAIAAVQQLAVDAGMPSSLSTFGVTASDLDQLAVDALADPVMVNTPRQPTALDVTSILAAAL